MLINETEILAVIVTYNPQICELEEKISCLKKQVSHILIFDNNSKNKSELDKINSYTTTVTLNSKNIGLAHNYNRAIEYGIQNDFTHLLILDQDSDINHEFISEYIKYASNDYSVLVPLLEHENKAYNKTYPEKYFGLTEVVEESINSGLFLNLKKFPIDLRFDEDYFIDCIDFDFFKKIKEANLKVLRVNSAVLNISLGNITKVGPFFLYNYSPFRLRKQAHDRIVFLRKHIFSKKAVRLFFFASFNNVKIILFEKQRLQKLQALFLGTIDGLRHKIKKV